MIPSDKVGKSMKNVGNTSMEKYSKTVLFEKSRKRQERKSMKRYSKIDVFETSRKSMEKCMRVVSSSSE